MSLYRVDARVDANQPAIKAEFERLGFKVYVISKPVDLAVARNGRTRFVEVKDGSKSPSKRCLTPAQREFIDSWPDVVPVVESIADVQKVAVLFFEVEALPA